MPENCLATLKAKGMGGWKGMSTQVEIELSPEDFGALMKPIQGQGGFQNVLGRLQAWADPVTRRVYIPVDELESIVRYVMKYGEGGFQDRLRPIADEVKALVDSVLRGIN